MPYNSGTSTRQQQGQQQEVPLPCGVMEIAPLLPGVMQTMVVTMVVTSAVRDQLKGVLQIQATGRAFAAIPDVAGSIDRLDLQLATQGPIGGPDDQLLMQHLASIAAKALPVALCSDILLGASVVWPVRLCKLCPLCCNTGRWIRCDLGECKLWRGQFGSSRSAEGCGADSSHKYGLCCDTGRSIRRYRGLWGSSGLWR